MSTREPRSEPSFVERLVQRLAKGRVRRKWCLRDCEQAPDSPEMGRSGVMHERTDKRRDVR